MWYNHIHTRIGFLRLMEEVDGGLTGRCAKKILKKERMEEIKSENWQGKLVETRWSDNDVDGDCFVWLTGWRSAPSVVPSRTHRNCTSTSFLRKYITKEERDWIHYLISQAERVADPKIPRRTCWMAVQVWRRPNTLLKTIRCRRSFSLGC